VVSAKRTGIKLHYSISFAGYHGAWSVYDDFSCNGRNAMREKWKGKVYSAVLAVVVVGTPCLMFLDWLLNGY